MSHPCPECGETVKVDRYAVCLTCYRKGLHHKYWKPMKKHTVNKGQKEISGLSKIANGLDSEVRVPYRGTYYTESGWQSLAKAIALGAIPIALVISFISNDSNLVWGIIIITAGIAWLLNLISGLRGEAGGCLLILVILFILYILLS